MISHWILICIHLIANNIEYLLMCLFAIPVSSSVKCFFLNIFTHFLIELFGLFAVKFRKFTFTLYKVKVKWSHSVMSDSLLPHGLQPTRLLHPWNFLDKSTGVPDVNSLSNKWLVNLSFCLYPVIYPLYRVSHGSKFSFLNFLLEYICFTMVC